MIPDKVKTDNRKNVVIEIVEDDLIYLKLLREQLARKGFTTIEAKDGKEGLELAKIKHPDLILLDIRMPSMDGMMMLRELRKDKYGKSAIVIVLTNLDPSDRIIKQVIEGKPSYYFVKTDITFNELLTKMEELLFPGVS